jgi:hypothetical protein
MVGASRRQGLAAVALGVIAILGAHALATGHAASSPADTLNGALVQAYQNNPQLNAERARLRATDETVPQALSGYRPQISATADIGRPHHPPWQHRSARRRRNGDPDDLQRPAHRQSHTRRRKPGLWRA